jgi:hypothetical protein
MPEKISMVQLIVDPGNAGWILEKIALRLKEQFEMNGSSVQILDSPTDTSDVVFWLYFGHRGILSSNLDLYSTRLKSALVTHVDDSAKVNRIRKLNQTGVDLVFMSAAHALEISSMVGSPIPFFNILLGTDFVERNRKMKIGIFSKCFPDGRKNEEWLVRLAKKVQLQDCEFVIIGSGWERIRKVLEGSGAQVKLYDGSQYPYPDYSEFPTIYRSLDLYLYTGFDEGAMGSLDAYVLGVRLLISRQGFHKEFETDANSQFSNYQEFEKKFIQSLEEYRVAQKSLQKWSWENCATSLMAHWSSELSLLSDTHQLEKRNPSFLSESLQNRSELSVRTIYKARSIKRLLLIRIPSAIFRRVKVFFKY